MKRISNVVVAVAFICGNMVLTSDAFARERKSSGSYQGRSGGGTFQKNVNRSQGSTTKRTTWQNKRGEGSLEKNRTWDKSSGTGSYSGSLKTATDKTATWGGTVKKNDDGSFSQNGTITGPKGKTTTVDRDFTKNDDGSRSVDTVYTGQDGKTLTIDKDITHGDGARNVTGDYSTSTGKSGTFTGTSTVEDGKIVTDRSLTDQDGRTWGQNVVLDRDGNTVTRQVTNTNPWGIGKTFNQSVTVDNVTIEK